MAKREWIKCVCGTGYYSGSKRGKDKQCCSRECKFLQLRKQKEIANAAATN